MSTSARTLSSMKSGLPPVLSISTRLSGVTLSSTPSSASSNASVGSAASAARRTSW
jgi:hypothetical protein